MIWGWYLLLCTTRGFSSSITVVAAVFTISQIGKYVPGNVVHHVGRISLARRYGFNLTQTLFTMFIETLWLVAVATCLAVTAIVSVGDTVFAAVQNLPSGWLLVGVVLGTLVTLVAGRKGFDWLAKWWAKRQAICVQSVKMPPLRTFCAVGVLYSANYLTLGAILSLLAVNVFGATNGDILVLAGSFAVASVIGFITPGAPGGLGVREVVLVAALSPLYGQDAAVGLAAMLRVVTVLGDGLAFLIGVGLSRVIPGAIPDH